VGRDEGIEREKKTAWLRIVVAVAVLVVLAGIAAITVVTALPERCMSCHGKSEHALEIRESHADVACLDCHGGTTAIETAGFAAHEVFGMYLRLPLQMGRTVSAVDNASCESCHDVTAAVGVTDSAAVRIDHATCTVGDECTDCHSRVAHGDSVRWPREYDMFDCVSCHMTKAASVECDLCHTERSREERIRTGTFALTHGSNWRQAHGMGDSLACAACHPSDKCVGCHGPGVPHTAAFAKNHSDSALQDGAQCDTCHTPAFCDDCHGLQMPHPADFAPSHSDIVEANGTETCERCHAPSDCSICHVKHVHPGNAKPRGGD